MHGFYINLIKIYIYLVNSWSLNIWYYIKKIIQSKNLNALIIIFYKETTIDMSKNLNIFSQKKLNLF